MIGDSYRFKVGAFECLILCDAEEHLASTWLLPTVPADELQAGLQAEGYGDTLTFSMNMLVVRTPEQTVLVDTGLPHTQTLPQNLKANGIDPASIDRVIISHGDDDHIGGIAYMDDVLTYPNARYSVWKAEWEHYWAAAQQAENPNLIARRCLSAIQNCVDRVETDGEITPGIRVIHTPGHKIGHMAVLVQSQGESLLHMVDAIHHPVQVAHPEWTPGFEMLPDVSPVTRRTLVQQVAHENWLAMAYHFPFPGLGHIRSENGKLIWEPLKLATGN